MVIATLLSCMVFLAQAPAEPKPQDIKYITADGVTVAADYFAPTVKVAKAPVAILIHMYATDRKSWTPLVQPLLDTGFAVLAYDTRGRGGSIEPERMELRNRYGRQDTTLFLDAWQDAAGAVQWLGTRAECDTTRIVLIGASSGASIAIDYATHEPNVKAIVGLSPYMKTVGIETSDHIKKIKDRLILLLAPEKELGRAQDLAATTGGKAKCEMLVGGPANHGTNLLKEPNKSRAIELIVNFVKPITGASGNAMQQPVATDDSKPKDPSKKK
ncbi:MAG: alpha/beta fold hydrolase [Planctomycetota bacterium]